LGNVLDSFPVSPLGSIVGQGQGLQLGLALFSVCGKDSKSQITLKLISLPAGKGKSLAKASIFDYRSVAERDHPLQSIEESDSAEFRISAQPSQDLTPGPETTGSPQPFDFSKPYSPHRKSILEFHSVPTNAFTDFWNPRIERLLSSLKLTQAG